MSNHLRRIISLGIGTLALLPLASSQSQESPEASFKSVIEPIVMKNCNGCHTYGGHASGLHIDTYASLMKGGDRGVAVVPGHPESSLIMKVILRTDPALVMPPARPLAGADVSAIEGWIRSLDPASASKSLAAPVISAAPAKPVPAPPAPASQAVAADASPAKAAPIEVATSAPPVITPDQEKFFESKIRPLLTKNCYGCHTRTESSGLRLDSREAILKGGKRGPAAKAGDPDNSLLIAAVHYKTSPQMPPSGPLKVDEVAALEEWITQGLPWPKAAVLSNNSKVTDAQKQFWSFKPPVKPTLPKTDSKWAYNEIDRFVTAKYGEKHLKPVADADKRVLLRRVTYDLTGLPPAPADVQAFLDDKSPDAYEKLVDRLLASKAYGERWGRMWLDVVRYADTSGGDGDFPIPQATKYRDYVIKAFQEDKPYDRFVREQLAGDLLTSATESERWNNIVATGYLASTVRDQGKYAYVSDAVDNVGSAFLGMTVSCARCHDHKFDPIPTADYYSLYGILYSTKYAEPGQGNARFQRDFTYRDPKVYQREDYKVFEAQLKPVADAITAVRKLPGTYDDLVPQLEARRMHLFEHQPDLGESAYAVTEDAPQNVKIQHYGDPKDPGPEVPRGFLQVLGGGPLPSTAKGSGRLQLADWLVSKDNPLTARVMVNRIWQGHFGTGLVSTSNDFGTRGAAPANQELLDYLATDFIDKGWSVKALHREILLSHTYRLSSASTPADEAIDPDNALVWRHSRVRMDAEEIRDTLLATSGLLDTAPAGSHPFPPPHVWNWEDQNQFAPDLKDYENDKRTVYMMVPRSTRVPYFNLFDGPNTNFSTERRSASLTPLQALYFMNAPFPKRAANQLATTLISEKAPAKDSVQKAFLAVYSRQPSTEETERSLRYLHNATDLYATKGVKQGTPASNAWSDLIQAMYASNEFMFID